MQVVEVLAVLYERDFVVPGVLIIYVDDLSLVH